MFCLSKAYVSIFELLYQMFNFYSNNYLLAFLIVFFFFFCEETFYSLYFGGVEEWYFVRSFWKWIEFDHWQILWYIIVSWLFLLRVWFHKEGIYSFTVVNWANHVILSIHCPFSYHMKLIDLGYFKIFEFVNSIVLKDDR